MNDAGQTVAARQYFDLVGLTYSTALALGTEGVNYLETYYVYDPLGRSAAATDPAGTITHVFYDDAGRDASQWTGTDDLPTVDYNSDSVIDLRDFRWYVAQYGVAPTNTNMVLVSASIYDGGSDMGDGLLTESRSYYGPGANDYYATNYQYDWRGRMAGSLGPDGVATVPVLDNLGRATETRVYASAAYSAPYLQIEVTTANLRSKTETHHDNLGRVYETWTYEVDQDDGDTHDHLTTEYWYLCMCQLECGDFLGFVGNFSKRGIGWSSFSQMSMAA